MESSYVFLSREWLDQVRFVLAELVEQEGPTSGSFSMCEVFLNAPAGSVGMIEPDHVGAWHFRATGNRVQVGEGDAKDVDVRVVLEYREAVKSARAVIGSNEEGSVETKFQEVQGDLSNVPGYLTVLHNRMAPVTL